MLSSLGSFNPELSPHSASSPRTAHNFICLLFWCGLTGLADLGGFGLCGGLTIYDFMGNMGGTGDMGVHGYDGYVIGDIWLNEWVGFGHG